MPSRMQVIIINNRNKQQDAQISIMKNHKPTRRAQCNHDLKREADHRSKRFYTTLQRFSHSEVQLYSIPSRPSLALQCTTAKQIRNRETICTLALKNGRASLVCYSRSNMQNNQMEQSISSAISFGRA